MDLEDDAVVTGADPPSGVSAHKFLAPLGRGCSARSSIAAWIVASPRGRAFGAAAPRPGLLRRRDSCQTEIGLDVLPRDRGPPAGHLLARSPCGLEIGQILRSSDQPIEVLGVDDRRNPPATPGQVDRVMLHPRGIHHIRQPGPSIADRHLPHVITIPVKQRICTIPRSRVPRDMRDERRGEAKPQPGQGAPQTTPIQPSSRLAIGEGRVLLCIAEHFAGGSEIMAGVTVAELDALRDRARADSLVEAVVLCAVGPRPDRPADAGPGQPSRRVVMVVVLVGHAVGVRRFLGRAAMAAAHPGRRNPDPGSGLAEHRPGDPGPGDAVRPVRSSAPTRR